MPYDPELYPTEEDIDRAFHPLPKDDAWRAVTLDYVMREGRRLVLGCCGCQRRAMVWPESYAQTFRLPMNLPLKLLERRIRCTKCGARIVHVTPETYSVAHDKLGKPRT